MPFGGLRAEIAREKLLKKDIAKAIGVSEATLGAWTNGSEAMPVGKLAEIRDMFFPGKTLDELHAD